ncbi:hypothetical protein [Streptomyces chartreusis]|uniref:hypothetical protein n=1 Tax=Streptomyces chartreusis TaxID=1969 RepID=UPI0033EF6174
MATDVVLRMKKDTEEGNQLSRLLSDLSGSYQPQCSGGLQEPLLCLSGRLASPTQFRIPIVIRRKCTGSHHPEHDVQGAVSGIQEGAVRLTADLPQPLFVL